MPTMRAVTLINPFEVPPDAEEAFVAGWERARDYLAARTGIAATALHRALGPDAEFRFVDVAQVDSPQTWQEAIADPDFPGGRMPFKARPGLYEVVHEDRTPDGAEGVILINPFEVPADEDERFLAGWTPTRDVLAQRPGYLGTRLHRSVAPQADFRFVNVARWSSPLAFSRAVQRPEFQAAAATIPHRSHPALYQVVRG